MNKAPLPPINYIVRRHGNHASVSGYDRISEYVPARIFKRRASLSISERLFTRLLSFWSSGRGSRWYKREDFLSECAVAKQWLRASGQIFHFVYGENSFRYVGQLKKLKKNCIVCTYHAPPHRFGEVVTNREHMRHIDAVIVVSTVLAESLTKELGADKVHYIPHGVDTDFFTPKPKKIETAQEFTCLFVGSHLRDFETLARVAAHFQEQDKTIRFEIITLRRDFHYFNGLDNVRLSAGISDVELRDAYRNADVLVMPMIDATANNSLLEAMACGLPLIVTDLPGVRDYVDELSATFVPVGDNEAFSASILSVKNEPKLRTRQATASRRRAEQFSFDAVTAMTIDVYRHVLEEKLSTP